MNSLTKIYDSVEKLSVSVTGRYESLPFATKANIESFFDYGVIKRIYYQWAHLIFQKLEKKLDERYLDRLEPILSKLSSQDRYGKALSAQTKETILELKYRYSYSDREIRIALERKYITKSGKADIDFHREQVNATAGWLLLTVILIAALTGLVGIWNFIFLNTAVWIVALQILIYLTLIAVYLVILSFLASAVAVRNILPISVAVKMEKRVWQFEDAGIAFTIKR